MLSTNLILELIISLLSASLKHLPGLQALVHRYWISLSPTPKQLFAALEPSRATLAITASFYCTQSNDSKKRDQIDPVIFQSITEQNFQSFKCDLMDEKWSSTLIEIYVYMAHNKFPPNF